MGTASLRFRRKCGHLLRDLAATADLPPHSALFLQQLLDLTHRWWTEREDNDMTLATSTSWQPQSISIFNCTQRGLSMMCHHAPFPISTEQELYLFS